MDKKEFIAMLAVELSGLPAKDAEERLAFYSEMIDDRVEEGMTEQEAVSAIGTVEEIMAQIIAETPLLKLAKQRLSPKRRLLGWEIALLVIGSPIWFSLTVALVAVTLSLYAVLWSLCACLWAMFASFAACAVGGVTVGAFSALAEKSLTGIAMAGVGLVLAGLAIFLFFGCKAATKGMCSLSKKIALGIKKCFVKKENVS